MKLVLHVGLHKTGTTLLQEFLHSKSEELLAAGVLYPQTGLWGKQHAMFARSLMLDHPFVPAEADIGTDKDQNLSLSYYIECLRREILFASPRLVILSSEVFCEIREQWKLNVVIKELSGLFDESTILITSRDSVSRGLSSVKHMIREGFVEALLNPREILLDQILETSRSISRFVETGLNVCVKRIEDSPPEGLISFCLKEYLGASFSDNFFYCEHFPSKANEDTWSPIAYLFAIAFADALVVGLSQKRGGKQTVHMANFCQRLHLLIRESGVANPLRPDFLLIYIAGLAAKGPDDRTEPDLLLDLFPVLSAKVASCCLRFVVPELLVDGVCDDDLDSGSSIGLVEWQLRRLKHELGMRTLISGLYGGQNLLTHCAIEIRVRVKAILGSSPRLSKSLIRGPSL